MDTYRDDLNQRFWEYQRKNFQLWQDILEKAHADDRRPPVFLPGQAHHNILVNPAATSEENQKLLEFVPLSERHKWFRSMSSSQALALSVLGNLAFYDCLEILGDLNDEDGLPIFEGTPLTTNNFSMERKINHLGERRSTSLDGFFGGDYQIAIECKFSEDGVGSCSRPRLNKSDEQHCDGSYRRNRYGRDRCSLTETGIGYWYYVPMLFEWAKNADYEICPLQITYQLVRNVLAVGVKPEGTVSSRNGHAVMIFDDRNPAFQPGGKGYAAYQETRSALLNPGNLRSCTWQQITGRMREMGILPQLTEQLKEKYGI